MRCFSWGNLYYRCRNELHAGCQRRIVQSEGDRNTQMHRVGKTFKLPGTGIKGMAQQGSLCVRLARQNPHRVERVGIRWFLQSFFIGLVFAFPLFRFTRRRPRSFIGGFPMIKTRKSIAKKFKVTGSGKVLRRKAGHRHFLRNKSNKQKRGMCQDQRTSEGVTRMVRVAAPSLFR